MLVVGFVEAGNVTGEGVFGWNGAGKYVYYTAQAIGAILKGSRPFDDFDVIGIELVDFKSVVSPPLLPFLFDALAIDDDSVEGEAPDDWFSDAGTYIDGADAGEFFNRLHESASA